MADLSNPILQPWAREELRKVNEWALSGKPAYTPKERCWPIGVPGFVLYAVFPTYFLQTPKKVVMIWAEDHQVRHIYLNRRHSTRVKPSWFGESVGRYEGDTLVVDTIGLNTRTFVDSYRTPHTDNLHVLERFHTIDGGRTMEVRLHVEDAGPSRHRGTRFNGIAASTPAAVRRIRACRATASKKWLAPKIMAIF